MIYKLFVSSFFTVFCLVVYTHETPEKGRLRRKSLGPLYQPDIIRDCSKDPSLSHMRLRLDDVNNTLSFINITFPSDLTFIPFITGLNSNVIVFAQQDRSQELLKLFFYQLQKNTSTHNNSLKLIAQAFVSNKKKEEFLKYNALLNLFPPEVSSNVNDFPQAFGIFDNNVLSITLPENDAVCITCDPIENAEFFFNWDQQPFIKLPVLPVKKRNSFSKNFLKRLGFK